MDRSKRTPCYCRKLRRASGSITQFYDRMLEPSGLTACQCLLLMNLSQAEEVCVRELADKSALDRSTLARNLKPLYAKGLIADTRKAGTRDCRLVLTENGRQVLAQATELWKQAQARVQEKLTAAELEQLDDLLYRLEEL